MKKLLTLLATLFFYNVVIAQTPVPMAIQPGLTYTENFDSIANWTNGFAAGTGANRFSGLPVIGGAGTTPVPTRVTAATTSFVTGSTAGVQRGTDQATAQNSIVLLSVMTADNTTSTAIDMYFNFSGVNAGNLSFDYQQVNNSTGNRAGSLRVYATTDGVTFSEIIAAQVLNFINNVPFSGSITNVALPASFNNNPNARLRFYYNNGTGGTTGSRPKLSLDNISVTAVGSPCITPAAQPTNLVLSNITASSIDGSFTATIPAVDEYLVVASNNSSLTGNPVNGTSYNIGDGLGDGTVIYRGGATSFSATGLSAGSHYYFFVFAANSFCNSGPFYQTTNPLINDATTGGGLPACAAPATQPTNVVFGVITQAAISASFTATAADEYLIVRSTSPTLGADPVSGQSYSPGANIGSGIVVQSSTNTSFTATGLVASTQYYFFIYGLNSKSCNGGPSYNVATPLTGNNTTQPLPLCATPLAQATVLSLSATNNSISVTYNLSSSADNYLIVQSTSPTLSATPIDNTNYNPGDIIGGGTVVTNTSSPAFISTGLTVATTYYYFIFASNKNCTGGTKYLTASPLTGNATTTNVPPNNYYFGNLHAHSDYSDGNKDNPTYTPADDYLYAMSSLCLDYLGISEHNHYSANNNPGNKVANYHLGSSQATTFTSSHPGFLAMYGMEWGVISGGGHVVVYGDGMDQLFGWETGSGSWGTSNNYDVFVAKSDYTGTSGLFKTINDRSTINTFATLAHPNSSDFNNIANLSYNAVADDAIVGSAVESGPAFSTNTTYTEPASSLSYLDYYKKLLAKGYHLGPTIDHDNHNTTFGRTTRSRTAIIAPALTRTEIVKAMRNMHFYATQDCDTKVDFTINTKIMGTVFSDRFPPNIAVTLTDATTSLTGAIIKIMFGTPGNGIDPVQIYAATGSTLSFTDNNLPNLSTGYYYLDITNGTSRIITSPIWYTRSDATVLPVMLTDFAVQKLTDKVKIVWATAQESNSKNFIVERSADGIHWQGIATVVASGNSSVRKEYTTYDNDPIIGINYYRLKQVDRDNGFAYSPVKSVSFNAIYNITVSPNPAKDNIHIYIHNSNVNATIQLMDATGKLFRNVTTTQSQTILNVPELSKGIYFIKVMGKYEAVVLKVYLQ